MRRSIFVLMLCLNLQYIVTAQVKLTIKAPYLNANDTLELRLIGNYIDYIYDNECTLLRVGNEDGAYSFNFSLDGFNWLELHLPHQRSKMDPVNGLMQNFLVAEDDSLTITLIPKETPKQLALAQYDDGSPIIPNSWEVKVSGRGSDKYKVKQFLDDFVDSIITALKGEEGFKTLNKISYQRVRREVDKMVFGDTARYSSQAIDLLVANAIGKIKKNVSIDLRNGHFGDIHEYLDFVEFEEKNYTQSELEIFSRSPDFLQYLEAYYVFKTKNIQPKINLSRQYALIKDELTQSELRERVVTNFLAHRFHFEPTIEILEDAHLWMKDTLCLEKITSLANAVKGQKIEFSLPDVNERKHQLSDFSGKVIFIDFWYKSCLPCKLFMKNVLRPLATQFKDDERFQIITISIDDRHIFESSLIEESFLPEPGLHLYTEGKRSKHPLIKRLGIGSYPRPFLLDKEGRIVATKFDLKELDTIITLVDQYLAK